MSISTNGWIEAKQQIGKNDGKWIGVIKIDWRLFRGLSNRELQANLYEFGTKGMPDDASDEVKNDWNDSFGTPWSVKWDDVWQMDTEATGDDWWVLVGMVNALRDLNNPYETLEFRFVFWVG